MDSLDFIRKAKGGQIDIVENTKKILARAREINKGYHYFLYIAEDEAMQQAKEISKNKEGMLYGLPVSVKDCICVKDMESRSGSRMLKGYRPVFDATVIEKVRAEGGIIIGKTAQDIFGFGSFNVNVGMDEKIPKNPFDEERVTGGSSGGSSGFAQMVGMPHISISESTGGSIASPASYCGVYGFCPTYGRVSRHGLIAFSNSMDKIGVTATDVDEIALMLGVIAGYDDKDSTSSDAALPDYLGKARSSDHLKIAVVKESIGDGVHGDVIKNLLAKLGKIKYDLISLPLNFKYSIQTYYLINMAEVSTNLAMLCGMRYGVHEPLEGDYNGYFTNIRSHNFEKEAKRRIILGTFARMAGFRDAYYMKALKIRTRIIDEYKKAFGRYDLIITPSMPSIAPKITETHKMSPLENYLTDIMTAGPNLAGFPHISIPSGWSSSLPTGMLVTADHFHKKN